MKIDDVIIHGWYRLTSMKWATMVDIGVCVKIDKELGDIYLNVSSPYVNSPIIVKADEIIAINNALPPIKIRRFKSGAVRSDDTGRIRPDYISPYAIEEIAQHFTEAKNDFGATNYFKGIKPEDVLPSIGRHYLDLHKSIIEDNKDAIRLELRAIGANIIMALHQIVIEEKGMYKEIYEQTEIIDNEK